MPGRIDVLSNRTLQATLLALRSVDKETRRYVRQTTQKALQPEFAQQMAERTARSNQPRLQSAVLVRTSKITASDQNIKMKAGQSTRRLKGGLQPSEHGKAIEFGSNRNRDTKYTRKSPKGKSHTVTRNAQTQLPFRRRKGWAFYPTANELAPRFLALWVSTAIRTTYEALEGKKR